MTLKIDQVHVSLRDTEYANIDLERIWHDQTEYELRITDGEDQIEFRGMTRDIQHLARNLMIELVREFAGRREIYRLLGPLDTVLGCYWRPEVSLSDQRHHQVMAEQGRV